MPLRLEQIVLSGAWAGSVLCCSFDNQAHGASLSVPSEVPSISEAIEALAPGDTVRVEAGSHEFSGTIHVPAGFRLIGDGVASQIFSGILIDPLPVGSSLKTIVENLSVIGNRAVAIEVNENPLTVIRGCRLEATVCLQTRGGVFVEGCELYAGKSEGGVGFSLAGGESGGEFVMRNNLVFTFRGGSGLDTQASVSNVEFVHNTFFASLDEEFSDFTVFSNGASVLFRDNIFWNMFITCSELGGVTFENNCFSHYYSHPTRPCPPLHSTTSFVADPSFCESEFGSKPDVSLFNDSPCAGTATDGGDIGARGVGCVSTPTMTTSWSQIKSLF